MAEMAFIFSGSTLFSLYVQLAEYTKEPLPPVVEAVSGLATLLLQPSDALAKA
ncbi:hypothetical protein [Vibrio bivalvicida]|uniref:hypothetical protein n=1 Tax=Vibrio bivalvicida TaxID=1276888 RepID=UPI0012F9BB0C|nr:hypothetical protein [Vibrio bivalvicida]